MSVLREMVVKDLKRQVRAPMAISFVLMFPVLFSGLLALTFGSGGDRMPRARLLVQDLDGSMISGFLLQATENEQVTAFFDIRTLAADEDGWARIESDDAAALLRIPAGFGQRILDGMPVELELIRNPAQSIMPEIAEQAIVVLAETLDAASWAFREPLETVGRMTSPDASGPTAAEVSAVAGAIYAVMQGAQGLVMPPAIQLQTVQLVEEGTDEQAASRPS